MWEKVDIETFEVPDVILQPDAVKTPYQYFKELFTNEMVEHIAYQTNLYSVQVVGYPIKTSPAEIEDFLSALLYMGVFTFPSVEDYWSHTSEFPVISEIMSSKRFKTLRRYLHLNDNTQQGDSPDRFFSKSVLCLRCSANSAS